MVKQQAYKPKRSHKPRKKKQWITPGILVGIFLGFLMVTSMFGFIGSYTSGEGNYLDYNGIRFTQTPYGYTATINDIDMEFSYYPESVLDLVVPSDISTALKSVKALTVTYDPSMPFNQSAALVQFNLEQVYDKGLGIFVTRGLTNNEGFPSLPNATCADATPFVPVLSLEQGNSTQIVAEGSCIKLQATSSPDLVRLHDRLAYELLGVISNE